ncbi:Ig kappa chain V19-17-like, partial [Clarias magur]
MILLKTLPFLCVMGLFSETLCFLTLEAEAGDKVTIWCEHDPTVANYISWFKHTSDSVPLRLGCEQVFKKSPAKNCYFFTESERIVMSVYDKNTSLTITAVNVSDTGLYYCGYSEEIIFSNSTFLHVKGKNVNISEDKARDSDSHPVLFLMTVVFGALTVILLSILIFIIVKYRKTHRVWTIPYSLFYQAACFLLNLLLLWYCS